MQGKGGGKWTTGKPVDWAWGIHIPCFWIVRKYPNPRGRQRPLFQVSQLGFIVSLNQLNRRRLWFGLG